MIKRFASKIFGKAVEIRNHRYDNNDSDTVKANCPVISVGNLSVGGTGKTPFVQMLTGTLIKLGRTPAIIGRGYNRDSKGEIIVCDGKEVLATAEEAGDEMLMLAESLRVPVIAHDSKSDAAENIHEKFDIDAIIVDDGFQHRRLERDLDIVIIDKETAEKPYLMPEGRLREPLESLERADVVCYTGKIQNKDELRKYIREDALEISICPKQSVPYRLINDKPVMEQEFFSIKSSSIIFSGIANPERFKNMLEAMKYHVEEHVEFSDHHKYSEADIDKLIELAKEKEIKNLLTTEKDAAKIKKYAVKIAESGIMFYVIPVKIQITEGKEQFIDVLKDVLLIE